MKESTKQLIEAYGWESIHSNNPHMASFKKKESSLRLNYYFTTGTLSVQGQMNDNGLYFKNKLSDSAVEEVLKDFK